MRHPWDVRKTIKARSRYLLILRVAAVCRTYPAKMFVDMVFRNAD